MADIWFTADQHLDSKEPCRLHRRAEAFSSSEEHDHEIIESANRCAKRYDTLVIVGDFALKNAQKWKHRLTCKHCIFIIGNHDRKMDSIKAFGEVHQMKALKTPHGRIHACHYPMVEWLNSHWASYHAYGHTHSEIEWVMDRLFPQRRSMDVGVDNAFELLGEHRPFHVDEMVSHLSERSGHHPIRS